MARDTGETVLTSPAETVAELETAPEPTTEPVALPATGSPYFMIGLGGLLAVAAGLTLNRLAYRKL